MHTIKIAGLCLAVALTSNAAAADKPFTGKFFGNGRACYGGLYVRSRTIEWHSTYSACERGRYQVLEQDMNGTEPRIAYLLKQRSKHCRYEVIELYQYNDEVWSAKGYRSLEAFQKKDLPDWKNSALPERGVLLCGMHKTD
ncbi:hypothetical protein [Paraherbaspirillum soli]|uniref:Uncharacterized protein n=1 Tax=Paraherbaspirillum soli TaxID=631222 RepID=A0ABW0MEP2_9BURK